MKRQVFLCLCLWSLLASAIGKIVEVYVAEGQTLTLRPHFQGRIQSMEWKRNRNLLAEWDGTEVTRYDDRITLNVSNGALELVRAVAADGGEYTLSLNDVTQDDVFTVTLIGFVPEPEVYVSPLACSDKFESCVLHCGGNTNGAEPLTYFWRTEAGKEMPGGRNRSIDRTTVAVKSFFCVMQNPLGRKESRSFGNPFYRDQPASGLGPGEIAGVAVAVVLTLTVAVLVYLWYRKHRTDSEFTASNAAARGTNLEAARPLSSSD